MEDPYVHMDLQKEQQPQVSGAEFQVPFVSVYGAKARSRDSLFLVLEAISYICTRRSDAYLKELSLTFVGVDAGF
jgi:hypothetical protein